MLTEEVRNYLLTSVFNAAVRAGGAIMQIYKHRDDYDVTLKSDRTPHHRGRPGRAPHHPRYLGQTRIPILSEEGREMLFDERRNWDLFLLVDPLDGTVEFIKGNNEFTVNIALMADNVCVASVLYVPYHCKMYMAVKGHGAYMLRDIEPQDEPNYDARRIHELRERLPLETGRHEGFRVAVSRSHQTPETFSRIDELRAANPDLEIVEQGSSYKFCLLAEGTVDYYVRTTNTYEWDTAAGELILAEAGGSTLSFPEGTPLQYNKSDLHNPWFEARSAACRKI